jgi:hypothetical protein
MPWLNTGPMDQKISFISRALAAPRGQLASAENEIRRIKSHRHH